MINKLILQGYLAADPDFHPENGDKKAFVLFRVLHSESTKEDADTFAANCIASGEQAKYIARTFGKGSAVLINGTISDREWDKKDGGGKGFGTSVRIDEIHFSGNVKEPAKIPAGAEKADRRAPVPPASAKPVKTGR